ncbi:MAG: T9SS type A sorting domain-containing protein [Bacteroidales bacterium]|nr:T9SS type A sorting domain-containing protein [Bacteroidales bacterium]
MKRTLLLSCFLIFFAFTTLWTLLATSLPSKHFSPQKYDCQTPQNFSVFIDYDHYDFPVFILSWDSVPSAILYNIYDNGNLVHVEPEKTFTVLYGAVDVEYCFSVTATCNNNSESDFSDTICKTITAPNSCEITDFLVVAVDKTHINIAWEPVNSAIGYNIYRNNELLSYVTANSYVDTAIETNHRYCYSIQTICLNGTSELSPEECETANITEISSSISVFPNPAHHILNIQSDTEIDDVRICNLLGQSFFHQQHCPSFLSIPVTDWAKGLYVIRVLTQNEKITQKIIIQ